MKAVFITHNTYITSFGLNDRASIVLFSHRLVVNIVYEKHSDKVLLRSHKLSLNPLKSCDGKTLSSMFIMMICLGHAITLYIGV